jgi:hypothetical protein
VREKFLHKKRDDIWTGTIDNDARNRKFKCVQVGESQEYNVKLLFPSPCPVAMQAGLPDG